MIDDDEPLGYNKSIHKERGIRMKKILSVILMIAMLLSSVSALAETADATILVNRVNLSDIVLTMNDEPIADLTGMTISLGAGATDDAAEGIVTAYVNGGEETAGSGGIMWSGDKLAANLDGLSQPLTLDLAELFSEENVQRFMDALMAEFTEEELAALQQIFTAVTELASEETLEQYMDNYEAYTANVTELMASKMTMEEGVSHAFSMNEEGEVSATKVAVNIDGETMSALMKEAFAFYDSNPALLDLFNGILLLDGDDVQMTSFADLYDQAELEEVYAAMDIVMDIYISDDSSLMDMAITITEKESESEAIVTLGMSMADEISGVMDMTADGEDALHAEFTISDTSADFNAVDSYGEGVAISFYAVESEAFPGETEYNFGVQAIDGDEYENVMNVWVGPDEDYGMLCSIVIGPDDEAVGLAVGLSDTMFVVNLYDEYMSIIGGYELMETGDGELFFSLTEDEEVYAATATVTFTTEEVAVADIRAAAEAEGINLMTISEDDISALEGELLPIAMDAVNVLVQNVPGLATLLGYSTEAVE